MPSDLIWSTGITGFVGLGGILSTSLTSLRLDKRRQGAEDKRLDRQRDHDLRDERRAGYHRTISLLARLDSFATGYPPENDAELAATLDAYNNAISALLLSATPDVMDKLRQVQVMSRRVGEEMGRRSRPGDARADVFIASWRELRDEMLDAERELTLAMRRDIAPAPTPRT